MNGSIAIVAPSSSRIETALVTGVVTALLLGGWLMAAQSQNEDGQPRLFDWQISAFYDLNEIDQAIYNALTTAATDLWWIHGDLLYFGTEEEKANPWPAVEQLNEIHVLPPFVQDVAWEQQGEVVWERIASFSFEGSAVYYGHGGSAPGQSAYLLMLSHVHKGASYTDGAAVWIHPDPNAPSPETMKRDSLIIHGWKEVVPYSGAMEVERLKGA